jgi:phage gp29-like protein
MPIWIEPPQNASKQERLAADWVQEILSDVVNDLEDAVIGLMDAVGHGFSAVEYDWQRLGSEWIPHFNLRPQTWFQLSQDRHTLRLRDGSADGAALIPFGWLLHEHQRAKTGYLGRAGLCRCLIWPFIYKHYAVGDFAEFLETYGLPIIMGKYYDGASPAEKSSLLRAVTRLGHDARAIMPKEMELEIAKITGTGDGEAHLMMVDWAERSQSKAILGQTLSAEAKATGMGSGVAALHNEVRHDILKSDARKLSETLTRDLVYPLLTLNGKGGDALRRCPRWVFDLGNAEDIATFATHLPTLAAGGAKISIAWVHEKLRIPMAEDGEDVFGYQSGDHFADVGKMVGEDAGALASLKAAAPKAAAPDPDADRLAADTDPVMAEWLAKIEAMLEAADSLEEFRAMLLAAYPKLDTEAMAAPLAAAISAMNLAGRSDVRADGEKEDGR